MFDKLEAELDDCELTNLNETEAAEHVVEDDSSIRSVKYTSENNSSNAIFFCKLQVDTTGSW